MDGPFTDGLEAKFAEGPTERVGVMIIIILPEERLAHRTRELVDRQKEGEAKERVKRRIIDYIGHTLGANRIDQEGTSYDPEGIYARLTGEEALAVATRYSNNLLYIGEDPRIREGPGMAISSRD